MLEILLIGIALSMDAFAVTVSSSMVYPGMTTRQKLSLPVTFGLFQGIMPILGYYLGSLFSSFIDAYSGIVSCVILGIIGINMIKEGFSPDEESEKVFSLKILLLQAVATSIDAFAVGVSFAAMGAHILSSAAIIAASTFILTLFALKLGNFAGKKLGDKSVIIGGIILIIIGIKALL